MAKFKLFLNSQRTANKRFTQKNTYINIVDKQTALAQKLKMANTIISKSF